MPLTFTFVTLFPKVIKSYTSCSIFGKSLEKQLIAVRTVNIRDFASDAYKTCDDTPYGGGSGMVLMAQPLHDAIISVKHADSHVVFPTPAAPLFTQQRAQNLAQHKNIMFVCGRYEGIDERIVDMHVDEVLSVGDYVLSSGELASLVIADAVCRLVEGVIAGGSLDEESHADGLLEYPHYTRPPVFEGRAVPPILLSGNHAKVKKWRTQQSLARTIKHRPDMVPRGRAE